MLDGTKTIEMQKESWPRTLLLVVFLYFRDVSMHLCVCVLQEMQKLIGQTWASTLLLVWLTPCLFFAEQVQMPWS